MVVGRAGRLPGFDPFTYTVDLVGRQIVHHDHIDGLKFGAQSRFEIGQKDITVGG
jgi:hypothetical protein